MSKVDRYDRQNLSEGELEQYKNDLDTVEHLVSRMQKVQGNSTNAETSPIILTLDTYVELREAHFNESEALKLAEIISNNYYKDLKHRTIMK